MGKKKEIQRVCAIKISLLVIVIAIQLRCIPFPVAKIKHVF